MSCNYFSYTFNKYSILTFIALFCSSSYSESPKYIEPIVKEALFNTEDVDLLATDRHKIASSIASFTVNKFKDKLDAKGVKVAPRLIALALNLDPRNRHAAIANFQFKNEILRKNSKPEYSAITLAQVLQSRAQLLIKSGNKLNVLLAGYMLSAAVEIDSSNENAVNGLKMYQKDIGKIDWGLLLGKKGK